MDRPPPPPPRRIMKEGLFSGLYETKESKQATKDWYADIAKRKLKE